MSGFRYGDHGPYELTATKARHWHGRRGCCGSVEDMIDRHVRPLFTVELGRGGSFWTVTDATLEAGSTNRLFTALSGHESNQDPTPGRPAP